MIIIFIILGLIFGSFCSVLIYRLPQNLSIWWPPSSCCVCHNRLLARDNLPLFGYLLLRGKCRFCGEKYGFGYLLSELFCALIFGCVGFLAGYDFSLAPLLAAELDGGYLPIIYQILTAVVFCLIYVLCVIDFRFFAVPEMCLLITLALAAFVRAKHVEIALCCMGVALILKAFFELVINLLRPEFEQLGEEKRVVFIDSSAWGLFNFYLLLFCCLLIFFADFDFGKFFESQSTLKSLKFSALAYFIISAIAAILNEIFVIFKVSKNYKAAKIRVQKQILGAADIEMIGILGLFLGSFAAVFAAVFAAALIMICVHFVNKIFKISWRPEDEANGAQELQLPANALPFFPFLAVGMLVVLKFNQLAEVFSV